jgi:acylpyruvate hydrolase
MRLGSLRTGGARRVIAETPDGWLDVGEAAGLDGAVATSLRSLLAAGPAVMEQVRNAVEHASRSDVIEPDLDRLGPPIGDPSKILCIGLNYSEHAAEIGADLPKAPEIFVRFTSTLAGPRDAVPLPRASDRLDLESELAIVIGRGGRYIPRAEAMDHVAGYMVLNDFSVRDFQQRGSQWTPGKNFDGTAPCGPFLVTPDEVGNVASLGIGSDIDGATMQSSSTEHMIFDVPTLIADASTFATLEPGDIIATGTPPGVGFKRKPPRFVAAGEVVHCWVEHVGEIRNRVVEESEWLAERDPR